MGHFERAGGRTRGTERGEHCECGAWSGLLAGCASKGAPQRPGPSFAFVLLLSQIALRVYYKNNTNNNCVHRNCGPDWPKPCSSSLFVRSSGVRAWWGCVYVAQHWPWVQQGHHTMSIRFEPQATGKYDTPLKVFSCNLIGVTPALAVGMAAMLKHRSSAPPPLGRGRATPGCIL